MTIAQALQHCIALGLDRLDAQLLLLHLLGRAPHDRAWLLAHDADEIPSKERVALEAAALRRVAGEPIAYIVGHKEFYGLNLHVTADVLVPRPDTETLVEWALEVLQPTPDARVVDLGTGSGAIALALKATQPALQVEAVDFSHAALAVAQSNAKRLKLEVAFSQGSWLSGTHGRFQAIVSNPPYIRENDEHLPALKFEPRQALTAGADGMDDIRTIVDQAKMRLLPGGWLLLEHGYDQADDVQALLRAAGFFAVQSREDLAGIARCSGGQWAAE